MQDHGLSPLSLGRQRRPIIRSIRTLRIRQGHGLDGSTAVSTSPLRAASILTRNHFHEVSRANGPKGQGLDRKLVPRNQSLSRRLPSALTTLAIHLPPTFHSPYHPRPITFTNPRFA